jgi:copper transport protein
LSRFKPWAWIGRLIIAVLVTAAVDGISAGGAYGHAVLLETVPADGARLERAPKEVVLRFNEPIYPIAVTLLNSNGKVLAATEDALAQDSTMRVKMPLDLPTGAYVVSFRVASSDEHPVAGAIIFGVAKNVDAGAAKTRSPPVETSQLLTVIGVSNHVLHLAALLAASGAALFLLVVLGPTAPETGRLRRGVYGLIAVAVITALLDIWLGGARLLGVSLRDALTADLGGQAWQLAATSSLGRSGGAAIVGLLFVGTALASGLDLAIGRASALFGCLLALSSLALSGHPATIEPRWLALGITVTHGLGAAFWIGSFWPLLVILQSRQSPEALVIVQRFSAWAGPAVGVLIIAGSVLSIEQLGSVEAVLTTDYGRVWLAKIAVVLALLALAGMNRQVLTPRLARGLSGGARALRHSIAGEILLVAIILSVTAVLGRTPPPISALNGPLIGSPNTTAAPEHSHPHPHVHPQVAISQIATAKTSGYAAKLEFDPASTGDNVVTVTLSGRDGKPLTAREVGIQLSLPALGIEPFIRPLDQVGIGTYAMIVDIPIAGLWSIRLDALVTDFEKAIFRLEIPIVPEGK